MTDLASERPATERLATERLATQRLAAKSVPMTPRLYVRDIKGVTKRNLLRIVRTPQLLFMSIVQPTIILLLFRYVLGGSIKIPGVDYVDYIVPGIFLEAVLIGGMTTALALAQDLQGGMIDRFRSLPMARSAFLAGRTLADLCRSLLALAFIIGLGLLVGFRFHNTFGACVGGVALIVLFGYAFTWVYASVGLAVKDPQTAQMASILPMFILFFASSALVPVNSMPGWLQPFARESTRNGGHRLRPGPLRGGSPRSPALAGRGVVCLDPGGVLRGVAEPLSQGRRVTRAVAGSITGGSDHRAGSSAVVRRGSPAVRAPSAEAQRKQRHSRRLSSGNNWLRMITCPQPHRCGRQALLEVPGGPGLCFVEVSLCMSCRAVDRGGPLTPFTPTVRLAS